MVKKVNINITNGKAKNMNNNKTAPINSLVKRLPLMEPTLKWRT